MSDTSTLAHSVKELPGEIVKEVMQKLFEQLPGEWQLLVFCTAVMLIGLLVAHANAILRPVLLSSILFLAIQSTQLFVTSEDLLVNFLPYIAALLTAGLVIGYSKNSASLWLVVICASLVVNAIGTPIKLVLNMDEVALKIVAMSFAIGLIMDFVVLYIVAKPSRIVFRRNDS